MTRIPDLQELARPFFDDLLLVTDTSDKTQDAAGTSKYSKISSFGFPVDIKYFGAGDDSTFIEGINAAITAGYRNLRISQDYTVDLSAGPVITGPDNGIRIYSDNGSTLTFTDSDTFISVGATSGPIEFYGLGFYADPDATFPTHRVTICDFNELAVVESVTVEYCRFEGNCRFYWQNDGTTDPDVTTWGVTDFIVENNTFKNLKNRFINVSNVPVEYASFSKNSIHNVGSVMFFWSVGGTYAAKIVLLQEVHKIKRNDIFCDSDYWSDDPEGSYVGLSVSECYEAEFAYNSIVGLKATIDTGIDFSLGYLSCVHAKYHHNFIYNCGNNGLGASEERILLNSKGSPAFSTEEPTLTYRNNTFVVDAGYFATHGTTAQAQTAPVWYFYKLADRHVVMDNNYIDVPELKTQGAANSAAVLRSFRFTNNTLIVRDELLSTVLLRFEPASDTVDSKHVFEISGNTFDIAEKTAQDASLIRTTSTFTRPDSAGYMPQVVEFNDNDVLLRGSFEHIIQSATRTTCDMRNTFIDVTGSIVTFFDPLTYLRNVSAEFRVGATAGASLLPTGESIYYDDECDIDITFDGYVGINRIALPLSTDVLPSGGTAQVVIEMDVMQDDGDYSKGVTSFDFVDDGAGNLDVNFISSSTPVTAQIPGTSEQHLSALDVDSVFQHGGNIFSTTKLFNNASPAYFDFPTGRRVRTRIRKFNLEP